MGLNLPLKVIEVIRRAEGGLKEHYVSLVKGLVEEGFDVLAACNFNSHTMQRLESNGVKLFRFELEDDIGFSSDIRAILCLYRKIKIFRADVVHCHGFRAALTGRVAAFLVKCPCVYTVHSFMPHNAMTGLRFFMLRLYRKNPCHMHL